MRMEKIAGAVAVIALFAIIVGFESKSTVPAVTGSAPEPDLSMPPKCNSPEVFKKIEELLERHRSGVLTTLRDGLKTETNPKYIQATQAQIDYLTHVVLHIQSTTTLGMQGTFMSCSMDYDHGDPNNTSTWQYLVGRNDAGEIVFNSPVLQNASAPWLL